MLVWSLILLIEFKATRADADAHRQAEDYGPNLLDFYRGSEGRRSLPAVCFAVAQFVESELESAFISTQRGFVYLAAIINVATQLIVGWSIADHMRAELVRSALLNPLEWRAPARRLVHHSDRGTQYASQAYRTELATHGIECSMSRAGDCYDNAMVESLFGTIKQERVQLHT